MAGIGTQQIAFMPAHQQTDKARYRGNPRKHGTHSQKCIGRHIFAHRRYCADDIGKQGKEHKRALPHNRRLAA